MKIYFFSKKNLKKTCKSSSLNLCIAYIRINGCYMSNIKNKLFTYRFDHLLVLPWCTLLRSRLEFYRLWLLKQLTKKQKLETTNLPESVPFNWLRVQQKQPS